MGSSEKRIEYMVGASTCIRPSHEIWCSQVQRPLVGIESLRLQGSFPEDYPYPEEVRGLPENLSRDLAGNAFPTTVLQANVIASMISHAAWGEMASRADFSSPPRQSKQRRQRNVHRPPPAPDSADVKEEPKKNNKRPSGDGMNHECGPVAKLSKKSGTKGDCISIAKKLKLLDEFHELKNSGVKNANQEMLNRKRPGYFSGCCSDSKWGGSRKKFKWDLFQKMLPNQAAKFDEVPNWLKHRLGLDEIKAKGPKKELIPNELLAIADGILMEECTRGLEMDTKSVVSLFETLVDIYNEEAETYNKESQGKHVERLAELSESGKLTEDELEAIASKPPALVPVISKEWTEKRMQHTVERFCLYEPKRKVLWKNGKEGIQSELKRFGGRKKIANALSDLFGNDREFAEKSASWEKNLADICQLRDCEVDEINSLYEGTLHVEHSCKKTHMWNGEDMRARWAKEHNVVLLGADNEGPCAVPGGYGATMQPNDRASYLRAACGVPPNPLVANLADKELGPHDIPVISCPLRVSLAADAFAVKKLREYRSGAIIQWAWCSTGHVKEQELADWCYNGKKEDLDKSMELCRGGFRDMLFMSQVPEVDHSVLVSQWLATREAWDRRIAARALEGKVLAPKMKQRHVT
ncbi:unnamed protein product [Cladocopium goreaui]|uniref:Malate dehydrogenase 2, mitochondrial n=1 Tax=Cladocopium goreaui TaxID=2562237 RepID=A0A9P1CT23_9DINO|nr:unnamed protein product [Cladocopium goreaui]